MKRTQQQNKQLHSLLTSAGIDSDTKAEMVYRFTNGRTEHTSEMSSAECKELIKALLQSQSRSEQRKQRFENDLEQRSRRVIFRLMYDCGFIDNRMNNTEKLSIINDWIKRKTNLSGHLNSLSYSELGSVVNQLQAVRRRYNEKIDNIIGLN